MTANLYTQKHLIDLIESNEVLIEYINGPDFEDCYMHMSGTIPPFTADLPIYERESAEILMNFLQEYTKYLKRIVRTIEYSKGIKS